MSETPTQIEVTPISAPARVRKRSGPRLSSLVAQDRRSHPAVAVLAVLGLLAWLFFFTLGRGLTFYFDEWAVVIDRRDWTVDAFLQPHNEHLHITAVLAFKLLFATVGLDVYEPYRALVLLLHLAVTFLVFEHARRRIGDLLAVAAVVPLLFLGAGWENVMWPFQIGLLGSLAAGLGALLLTERRARNADVGAALLLTLALASASVAIPIALALAIEVAWRPPRWRRLWVVAVPVALYGLWSVTYGRSALLASNLPAAPQFALETAAATVGGLLGLGPELGAIVLVAALLWLGSRFVQRRLLVTPRLAGLTAALVASWMLTALARAHYGGADSSRYVYVGAVFVIMIAAELARGSVVGPRMLAVLAVLGGISLAGNYVALQGGLGHLRAYTASVEAALVGLELAGPQTPPDFRPAPERAPNIYSAPYFNAVEQFGSPAPSPDELLLRPDEDRQTADAVYVAARAIAPEAADGVNQDGPPPPIDEAHWGRTETDGSCVAFVPTAPGAAVDLTLSGRVFTLVVEENAHVDVHLRLFADGFPPTAAMLVPGESTVRIALPPPVAGREWHVRLFTAERIQTCTAAES